MGAEAMIVEDMHFDEYLALDCAASHRLGKILISPRALRWELDHPSKPNAAMQLGTDLHNVIPNGQPPANRTDKQKEALLDMRESLMSKPVSRVLFGSGRGEVTCLQTDPETGLELKCRFDWLPTGHDLVVDIKTARDASYEAFSRAAANYNYSLQAAFYAWMYELEFGQRPAFFFAVVENVPPYDSLIYEADEQMLDYGSRLYRRALDIYAECKRMDFWPGRDWDWDRREHAIQKLSLPRWVK